MPNSFGDIGIKRGALLRKLSDTIAAVRRDHPSRIAIDGVDGAGKTTLADELLPYVEARGFTVIRASIDNFHHSRAVRYRRGIDSPDGFYLDSFDYERLRSELLAPLGPGGDRRYRTAVFDWRTDSELISPLREASPHAILLFDGIFAQRKELRGAWDFVVFLQVQFEESLRRSQLRDAKPGQSPADLERRFWCRYAAGQRLYFAAAQPTLHVDLVVDYNDPGNPIVIRERSTDRV